ncbi:hypothetical protein LF817_09845 [Halobacillus sp. A1]|uniref:hypothetical protein n=1 Tax=Halobacillus sp. A1 TaxID=2880262 RepID=UPI0020A66472|nr:hypothetical protein [Halobacillus sp. A1]MCP3031653.1 hypothetical protein [Halobacillus sp. A1]
MIVAYGCGWFDSLEGCAEAFIKIDRTFEPEEDKVEEYIRLFKIYQQVYTQTSTLNEQLAHFRK